MPRSGCWQMALTDINNTSGCLDFLRLAPRYNIKPVIGVDFRHNTELLYIVIAKNNEGFKELNEFLTIYRQQKKELPECPPLLPNCFIIYPWKKSLVSPLGDGRGKNEFIGIHHADITAFRLYDKATTPRNKIVALAPLTFRNKKDFNTHRLLRTIFHNTLLSKLPVTEQGREEDKLLSAEELAEIYADFPEAIENAEKILQQSNVQFEFGKSKNKKCFTGSDEEDRALLEKLAYEGLHYRYKKPEKKVIDRLESELSVIKLMDFTAYFLINWDIVRFAMEKGFFSIGRGSGANSIVAYCLRITDVDPIELDLYFERFINPSRKNPPDFDIDFSHTDRDSARLYI